MWRNLKKIFLAVLILILSLASKPEIFAAVNANEDLPDKATLSANRMRFDSKTGDFLADGNVTITAGELKVSAPRGSGNVERREVNFDQGISASGKWQGEKINFTAGKLALTFNDVPTCKFQNGVKGTIGTMLLDADRLTLIGTGGFASPTPQDRQTKFWLVKVRNLEDRSQGVSFSADSVEGVMRQGNVHDLTAKNRVLLKGKPKAKDQAVTLRGDSAVYSLERGSVVVNGHVTAVQGGRTLRSSSIVYFPAQNRVEALGGVSKKKDGSTTTERAEITIDLSREKGVKKSK